MIGVIEAQGRASLRMFLGLPVGLKTLYRPELYGDLVIRLSREICSDCSVKEALIVEGVVVWADPGHNIPLVIDGQVAVNRFTALEEESIDFARRIVAEWKGIELEKVQVRLG